MNRKNLITVFLLILIMLCSITVCAETNESDTYYTKGKFYLESFGVDTEGLTYDSPVTRGFAANVVANALFDELSVSPALTKFADVPSDSSCASAAYLLNNAGIMQGDGKKFNPEKNITYIQAAKVFVSALGMDIVAQSNGGWPLGYVNAATKEGILDGVKFEAEKELVFGDFVKMYYNFTTCKPLELGGTEFEVWSEAGRTVLQHILHRRDMMYVEGVVKGNQFGSAVSDELGRITIETAEYALDCEISQDIVGYYADAFLTKRGAWYVVTSIMVDPAENNVRTIAEADIESTDIFEIKYYENNKLKTVTLNGVMVVRNGKVLNPFTKKDLVPLNGGIVLIDNNDDGKYECVHIENRQYCTVSRISLEKNVVVLESDYEGSTHLYINPNDEEFYHRIYKDGETITLAELNAGDLLRIEGGPKQDMMRVYVLDDIFDGKIEFISQGKPYPLTIDGKKYAVANDAKQQPLVAMSSFKVGNEYTFTVDGDYIIEFEKLKSDSAYAYVVAIHTETEAFDDVIKYKLVSEDHQLYTGELADKIFYNGTRIDKKKFTPKSGVVISYRVDSDGKICSIDDAEVYKEKANKIYKKATNILYSQTYDYPVFMSDKTVVFVVPDSGEDDDYMADLTLADGKTYSCAAYDYNEDDSSVSVVVIYDDVKYETPGYIYQDSPICILKEMITVWDPEKEKTVCQLTWLEGTEEKTAYVKDTVRMNSIVNKMAAGDVFQYAVTNRGFVNNINILLMPDQNPAYFHNGAFTSVEQVYGKVVKAESKVLPKGYVADFVNIFTLNVGSSANKSFLVSDNAGKVSYYLFNSNSKEVKTASFADVMAEDGVLEKFNASEIFIYYYGTSNTPPDAMAVVIKN